MIPTRRVDGFSRSGDPMADPIERKLAAILSADVAGCSGPEDGFDTDEAIDDLRGAGLP